MKKPVAARVVLLTSIALAGGACGANGKGADDRPVLKVTTWTHYMDPAVVSDFEKAEGCRVEFPLYYSSNDELLATLQKGQPGGSGYDLAFPSDVFLPLLIAQGLIEPIDRSLLPNAVHSDPAFASPVADPTGADARPLADEVVDECLVLLQGAGHDTSVAPAG